MDRLVVLEQVIQNMNEAIRELKAEVEALKKFERIKTLSQETLINPNDFVKLMKRIM